MPVVRTSVGARLHFGFQNLSLAHKRIYGGVGVAIDSPKVVLDAEPASDIVCSNDQLKDYAETACSLLEVDGIHIHPTEVLPRHVGLGSGTQHALAVLRAVAAAYELESHIREWAPALGRGGRSGVGVATFQSGGFVVDAGHPTERFTTQTPPRGTWTVPPVLVHHSIPPTWRFVVIIPDEKTGLSGNEEDDNMRTIIEQADPNVADELAIILTRKLIPALVTGRLREFGNAVTTFGRLNGAWYADVQGGTYRPPVGAILDELADEKSLYGLGQSSWGPAIYGITSVEHASEARRVASQALATHGIDAAIRFVSPRNSGVMVQRLE